MLRIDKYSLNIDNPSVGDIRIVAPLGKQPRKQIFTSCPKCGLTRWTIFAHGKSRSPTCNLCAKEDRYTPERNGKISKAQTKNWSNPTIRAKHTKSNRAIDALLKWRAVPGNNKIAGIAISKANKRPDVIEKRHNSALIRYENPTEKEKTRQANIKRYEDNEERIKTGEASKKSWTNHDTIIKHSNSMKEVWTNHEYKDKLKTIHKETYQGTDLSQRHSISMKKLYENPEAREKTGETSRIRWANPEYKDRVVGAIMKSLHLTPNQDETKLTEVLNEYFPNEWEFIGDGNKIRISGKVPDFKHKELPYIIESFGDHWHNPKENITLKHHQTVNGRTEFLSNLGYKTLILWEHEVKGLPKTELANRIRSFFYSTNTNSVP